MAINTWWRGDSRERFWVEITNRDDVGENLIAPQLNDAGREEWSYELVRHVRPGDIVLHWHKDTNEGPALIGYSHVSRAAVASSLEWQSRGSYGRNHDFVGQEGAWEALLQGYREFDRFIPLSHLRGVEPAIRHVRDDLQATYSGPLYFPFAISDLRPLRSAQAYLTKFPAALVDTISELGELRQVAVDESDDAQTPRRPKSAAQGTASGYGRQNDGPKRKAVEMYAVELVLKHYRAAGYEAEHVGDSESWDVTAHKTDLELHIEVKGSTIDRLAIDVTEGEIRHSEGQYTTLIVIDQITMDASLRCSGGRWRYWSPWTPDRESLIPTTYRHPLPDEVRPGPPSL